MKTYLFEFITKIGSGFYSTVNKVFYHSKKVYKAIKKFKKNYSSLAEWKKEIEVQILPQFKHSNIITFDKIVYENEKLYLVLSPYLRPALSSTGLLSSIYFYLFLSNTLINKLKAAEKIRHINFLQSHSHLLLVINH